MPTLKVSPCMERFPCGFCSLAPECCSSTLLQSERENCVTCQKFLLKHFTNGWNKTRVNLALYSNFCSNLFGSLQYIYNTYWNVGTVPVACVEIGTTVCATFGVLLTRPTLLWAGIDTSSQDSDRGCWPSCWERDYGSIAEGRHTLSWRLAPGIHVQEVRVCMVFFQELWVIDHLCISIRLLHVS